MNTRSIVKEKSHTVEIIYVKNIESLCLNETK